MTNEEAIKILKKLPKICGQGTAVQLAIKALENQERMQREIKSLDGIADTCDKLEKALAMACELVPKSDWCYTKESACDKSGCTMCMIGYFKRKAGIEVDN